jgi:F420-dependent oxidoreductase-like protein
MLGHSLAESEDTMKVGIHPVSLKWDGGAQALGATLSETAQAAEAAGMSSFLLMDHYFFLDGMGPIDDPVLEGYTTLGFLAGRTERLQLGLLVTGVTYRYPGLLAKIVATLDIVSGGRALLGIGAAWHEREHRGLGVPFPPLAERFERLEETVQICLQMWSDDDGPYEGQHFQLAETVCSPLPLQRPRPPILIGGSGERKTLRLVAQYADACNVFATSVGDVRHKLDILKRHCDDLGRDYGSINKTIMAVGQNPLEDVGGFLDSMAAYAEMGVATVFLIPRGNPLEFTQRAGSELVPAVLAMG